ILMFAINLGLTYIGINFPLDYCSDCKTTNVFENDSCSCCNGKNITKLRRVSGYLTTKETLKNGKKQEEKARIAHFKGENI
ncbi:anaerobic ribonucleoside-triphosphate reductase, partial [Cetobacterium sp.]|uniref:anaerobic ribonucleoside-triphosphate reductase n=1 Tax=Cetobacterium sp. TaxID=2071632 RepID=UPI003EE68226